MDSKWIRQRSLFGAIVILHSVGAVLVGFIGLILDAAVGQRLYGSASLGPFSPIASILVVVLGIVLSRRLCDRRASWAWVPGLLWLAFGAYEMLYVGGVLQTGAWQGATPSRFLFNNLFGAKCGDTECLDQVFFTLPFISTALYSISAWVTLQISRCKDRGLTRSGQAP